MHRSRRARVQGGKCMRMGVVPSPGLVTRASPGVRPVPSPVQATQKRALYFMRWGNGCVRSRAHVRCRSRGGRIVWRDEHAPIYRPQQSQANEGVCSYICLVCIQKPRAHRQVSTRAGAGFQHQVQTVWKHWALCVRKNSSSARQ